MRTVRLIQFGGIPFGVILGSLLFLGGCGGGAPPTGAQVQDIPSPVNIKDMYKSQPRWAPRRPLRNMIGPVVERL
jgi:hypothetical protein